jgi:hypothetical protein
MVPNSLLTLDLSVMIQVRYTRESLNLSKSVNLSKRFVGYSYKLCIGYDRKREQQVVRNGGLPMEPPTHIQAIENVRDVRITDCACSSPVRTRSRAYTPFGRVV